MKKRIFKQGYWKTVGIFIPSLYFLVCTVINLDLIDYTYASSISLSAPSNISIELEPSAEGTFATSDTSAQNISITTDNYAGYTLGVAASTENASNDLKNLGDNDELIDSISSISSPVSAEDFANNNANAYNNTWGLRPSKYDSEDNTTNNYYPAPTSTTMTVLDETSSANTTPNTYNLAVGVRATSAKAPGEYSGTIVITAIADASAYSISYNDPSGEASNLPANISTTTYGDTVTMSDTIPTRTGYIFAGWCTESVADNASCTGTTYAAGDDWTLDRTTSSNSLTLYAMWGTPHTVTVTLSKVDSISFSAPGFTTQTISTTGETILLASGVAYTITANASDDYTFTSWSTESNGTLESTSTNPTTYIVTDDTTLTAEATIPLTVNFDTTCIYGVQIKTNTLTGASAGVATTNGKTVNMADENNIYYIIPLYKSTCTLDNITASGGTLTQDNNSYGYYYYTPTTSETNSISVTGSKTLTTSVTDNTLTSMQDITSANSSTYCLSVPSAVRDGRDDSVYYIQRLADGNCWMLENLRFTGYASDGTTKVTLDDINSNVAAGTTYTLPDSGTTCFNSSADCDGSGDITHTGLTVAAINSDSNTTTTTGYGPGRNYIGTYYNYCAASVGTICTESNSSRDTYNVCPANWTMPTGGGGGQYRALSQAITGSNTNSYGGVPATVFQYSFSAVISGYFKNNAVASRGSQSYYWSTARPGNNNMHYIYVSRTSIDTTGGGVRYDGHSVRCLLK